nr:MAG TPA: Baseplate structural protein [Caudoviricetes sp.]
MPVVTPKLNFQAQAGDTTTAPVRETIKTNAVHQLYPNRYANSPIEPFGGDMPHNNIQPCIAVYLWKRTA